MSVVKLVEFPDSIGTMDWLGAMPGDLPPDAQAVYIALCQSPNGPHNPSRIAERAGLSEPATRWLLDALARADVIGERQMHDYVCYGPVIT